MNRRVWPNQRTMEIMAQATLVQRDRSSRGFTLIEVMVVVALIGVLAAIALPSFFATGRRAKAESEVAPYFQDLRTRMDQYYQENGAYPTSLGESTTCPATPLETKQNIYSCPDWPTFQALKVKVSGDHDVYCAYTWVTGLANDASNIGPRGTLFGFTAPATDWYYLVAHCNLDGNSAVDGYFFTSSLDPAIQKRNPSR